MCHTYIRKLRFCTKTLALLTVITVLLLDMIILYMLVNSQYIVLLRHHLDIRQLIKRSPLIAHCLTGRPRTLHYDEVFQIYKKVVLDNVPGDLFAVLEIGQVDDFPGIPLGTNDTVYKRALTTINPKLTKWLNVTDNATALNDPGGYGKWKICMTMIEEEEKMRAMKYEFIVRTRPDLMIIKELPPVEKWPTDRVLVNPYYECLKDLPAS
ncbi:unnamed protein product [Didymodactylos carnosus]|uniref:Uncharacterized protein n=1 Tax=Didymodactylos carnosus TaxID=1234261 RepID=A0A814S0I3_9BILA|nr:unnamed protein product [Didymodactylos carnosus]CAF1141488.1 unnamed protein product [Didymodactylos carnosus]CAF3736752.1 unnamed protein product [Didymodactylos carnosus]CAF3905200.1 unnamed protein product [Didymodactylos carnosus]